VEKLWIVASGRCGERLANISIYLSMFIVK